VYKTACRRRNTGRFIHVSLWGIIKKQPNQLKMKRLLIYPLLFTLIISCNKEAIQYEEVENFKIAEIVSSANQNEFIDDIFQFNFNEEHIKPYETIFIDNSSKFDKLITSNNFRLNQPIDFENQTLVGICPTFLIPSQFVEFKYKLLKETASDKYHVKISCIYYKGITSYEIFNQKIHWFIIPKISQSSQVDFDVIKKNGKLEDFDISVLFSDYHGQMKSINKDESITDKYINMKIEPITDNKPNVMFSYYDNDNKIIFGGWIIYKFENRIQIIGEEVPYGRPLLQTDYKLVNALYRTNSNVLFFEFRNPNDMIIRNFSGIKK
jgi:hypothetical protein